MGILESVDVSGPGTSIGGSHLVSMLGRQIWKGGKQHQRLLLSRKRGIVALDSCEQCAAKVRRVHRTVGKLEGPRRRLEQTLLQRWMDRLAQVVRKAV